ncbi:MAG: penicillin-binding protein activator LpoB [Spirochaetales bacterium]|jgi:PBP1b-binding outer membrane lipoprotein LpoB|nr:penicillin-binding protein activator LpoB [Spirochaetales bacterium]
MRNKRFIKITALLLTLFFFFSCSSTVRVSRLGDDDLYDLSGSWNDADINIVTKALVDSSLSANWITQFRMRKGSNPVVIVGTILNRSSEHIDTSIIAKKFEMALINTNQVDMVADIDFRDQLREEREGQQFYASEETAVALGREIGADFIFQGAVRTVVDQVSGKAVRTYYVSGELIDIETSRKVWVEEKSVRKLIKQAKYTW